ncbi:MAG: hypothetical protein IPN73_04790 [Saprospiraceae bacterium]|nr:hypothetical protein [Saprospiraceae bacterium]MBK8849461.1 hypothetical protein [Saprospiraceae bacterium]
MKTLLFSSIFLMFQSHLLAQSAFFSLGNGISNISSNFENRYSYNYNFTLKTGYERNFSKLGVRATIGYFNLNSKIIEKGKNLNISLIKISSGLIYRISSSWSLFAQMNIGKTTKKNIRISSPRYNYDFDPVDISYSFEIAKKINLNNCKCLSLGLEFSKSIDGIIDNNFWQKDNLKPYFLNVNFYYHLNEK